MATRIYQAIYFTSNVSHIPDAAVDEVIDDTLTWYASYNRVTVSAEYCTLCLRYSEHPALPLISSWESSSASTWIFVYKMYTSPSYIIVANAESDEERAVVRIDKLVSK